MNVARSGHDASLLKYWLDQGWSYEYIRKVAMMCLFRSSLQTTREHFGIKIQNDFISQEITRTRTLARLDDLIAFSQLALGGWQSTCRGGLTMTTGGSLHMYTCEKHINTIS